MISIRKWGSLVKLVELVELRSVPMRTIINQSIDHLDYASKNLNVWLAYFMNLGKKFFIRILVFDTQIWKYRILGEGEGGGVEEFPEVLFNLQAHFILNVLS